MNTLDINNVSLRNMYPAAAGRTVGQSGTTGNSSMSVSANNNVASPQDSGEVAQALSVGGQASPVVGALVFIALIVGLAFVAKRFGEETEFRNIRVSPFNVLIVSLAAIIGIPVWKYAFTKLPIPGVSTWVQSV